MHGFAYAPPDPVAVGQVSVGKGSRGVVYNTLFFILWAGRCVPPSGMNNASSVPKKTIDIESFLMRTYHSIAETLPHGLVVWEELSRSDKGAQVDREKLIQEILDVSTMGPLQQSMKTGLL